MQQITGPTDNDEITTKYYRLPEVNGFATDYFELLASQNPDAVVSLKLTNLIICGEVCGGKHNP